MCKGPHQTIPLPPDYVIWQDGAYTVFLFDYKLSVRFTSLILPEHMVGIYLPMIVHEAWVGFSMMELVREETL